MLHLMGTPPCLYLATLDVEVSFLHRSHKSHIFTVSGQQAILKNLDDGRKLSVHMILQQTGLVLQVAFTGSSPKQVTVAGGAELLR